MKVTVHSVTDQMNTFPEENKNFGLNDVGYNRAMEWLKKNQEYRGGERYEYFGVETEIKFMWDMTQKEFHELMRPGRDDANDMSDYLGAVFFGDFKLEFIWNDVGGAYNNLFFWGAEYDIGNAYAYLEDGTPYEEIVPPFTIPKRRTFESFAKNVEAQIIKWLNDNPECIEYALEITKPTKWYPDGHAGIPLMLLKTLLKFALTCVQM